MADTKTVSKANYTEEMVNQAVTMYEDLGNDGLDKIAEAIGKNVRSVRSKLVREGVYVASPKTSAAKREGPTKKELLAANKTNNEICEYIGAKSLKFLSLGGLYKAIGFDSRNDTYPQLTDHYFTGDYPVKPIDELGDNKVTQLSLLSTASNN